MNPYTLRALRGSGDERRFFTELGQWHDEMVLHQRLVQRVGPRSACSDDCPHVQGKRLWAEARLLLGAAAYELTFLRACAGASPRPKKAAPAAAPLPA